MQELSIDNGLVRKVIRSLDESRQETCEEIQKRYTTLHPPGLLFRGKPSISLRNLGDVLRFLEKEEYVSREVTRFTDKELPHDVAVFRLTQKGLAFKLKKK